MPEVEQQFTAHNSAGTEEDVAELNRLFESIFLPLSKLHRPLFRSIPTLEKAHSAEGLKIGLPPTPEMMDSSSRRTSKRISRGLLCHAQPASCRTSRPYMIFENLT